MVEQYTGDPCLVLFHCTNLTTMKIVNGSPVLLRGGDGRKAHLVDVVLTPGDSIMNPSLIAICFIRFDDGLNWWHGPSYMLVADTEGVFLTFNEQEHLQRIMEGLHVDTSKPLIVEPVLIFEDAEYEEVK